MRITWRIFKSEAGMGNECCACQGPSVAYPSRRGLSSPPKSLTSSCGKLKSETRVVITIGDSIYKPPAGGVGEAAVSSCHCVGSGSSSSAASSPRRSQPPWRQRDNSDNTVIPQLVSSPTLTPEQGQVA